MRWISYFKTLSLKNSQIPLLNTFGPAGFVLPSLRNHPFRVIVLDYGKFYLFYSKPFSILQVSSINRVLRNLAAKKEQQAMQNDFYDRALRYSSTQWYNQWPMGVPSAVGLAQLPPLTQANHIDKKDSGRLQQFFYL